MTLYATIELPDDSTLPNHCPDLDSLLKKLSQSLMTTTLNNLLVTEDPKICVAHFNPAPICGACAAPLTPQGRCSSVNCAFGKLPQRKPTAKTLAGRLGVKLGSQIKASHA